MLGSRYFQNGHGRSTESDCCEEDNNQRGGHNHFLFLFVESKVQCQCISDCSPKTTEPHDEHHFT